MAVIALQSFACYSRDVRDSSLTIRKLGPGVKRRLRIRAASHGRSMEAEAREILSQAVATTSQPSEHLVDQIRRIAASVGYFDPASSFLRA